MVTEIPVTWKSIADNTAFTALICAEVGFVAMSVHSMSFTLVTKETRRGGEARGLARNDLASVRLQVRIHEFADSGVVVSILESSEGTGESSYS
jgi:hypothetical protein